MRISDWSSDVCSSDLRDRLRTPGAAALLDDRDRTTARIARWHAPPAQVGRSHPSFARDYRDGREKFLDAASQAGARMEAHSLPERTRPAGNPISRVFAWVGHDDAAVVMPVLSRNPVPEGVNR